MNHKEDSSRESRMTPDYKRHTAHKVNIIELLDSEYIKKQGWEPSQFLISTGPVSRINIIGFIVSKEENTFLIDDGTGNISVRLFERLPEFDAVQIGSLVMLIGRPREWNNQRYIVPEIVRKIEDTNWLKVRLLELKLRQTMKPPMKIEQKVEDKIDTGVDIGPYQKILKVIQSMDSGEGVEYEDIMSKVGLRDCEKLISDLIAEGEIFEVGPRRLKVLE
ncbi:hypothetical protein JW930_03745 [Candidatus Woesearchaeota archaeon]|nr:hypothetical protein [Candidatus Woesearchaeota archaeon]